MTLAICIVCGGQKFGAFVACQECGFEPTDLADKAKSLALSDQNFPPTELEKLSKLLKSGGTVPFDPITLAVVARPIADEIYCWQHLHDSNGTLPCRRCGVSFLPRTDQVLCMLCRAEPEEPLHLCLKCSLIFESEAKHCQHCGAKVQASSFLTVKNLAEEVGIGVGRTMDRDTLAKSNVLAGIQKEQPKEQRYRSNRELMIVGFQCALLVLSKAVPSTALLHKIRHEMAWLYAESHDMRGGDSESADSIRHHCLRRWGEYGIAMARKPEKWELVLGNEAAKNCFGIEAHIGAAMDMVILRGFVIRVLQTGVIDSIMRREMSTL